MYSPNVHMSFGYTCVLNTVYKIHVFVYISHISQNSHDFSQRSGEAIQSNLQGSLLGQRQNNIFYRSERIENDERHVKYISSDIKGYIIYI